MNKKPVLLSHSLIIPRILLMNYNNYSNLPIMLVKNIENTIWKHKTWDVVKYSVEAMKYIEFVEYDIVYEWYSNTIGKYRSDMCRLIQLYIHGGVYVDNDIEVIKPFDTLFSYPFFSAHDIHKEYVFQSIIGSHKAHRLVKKAIIEMQHYIKPCKETLVTFTQGWSRRQLGREGIFFEGWSFSRGKRYMTCHVANRRRLDYRTHFNG